jgi:hypothetical protein
VPQCYFLLDICVAHFFPPIRNIELVNPMRHPLKIHFKAQVSAMKPFVGVRLRPRFSKVAKKRHRCSLDASTYSSFSEGKKSHSRCNQDLEDEVS